MAESTTFYLVELPAQPRETAERMIGGLFPALPGRVVCDAARFCEFANAGGRLNKEIATSELKQWARMPEYMGVEELTPLAVGRSISTNCRRACARHFAMMVANSRLRLLA